MRSHWTGLGWLSILGEDDTDTVSWGQTPWTQVDDRKGERPCGSFHMVRLYVTLAYLSYGSFASSTQIPCTGPVNPSTTTQLCYFMFSSLSASCSPNLRSEFVKTYMMTGSMDEDDDCDDDMNTHPMLWRASTLHGGGHHQFKLQEHQVFSLNV